MQTWYLLSLASMVLWGFWGFLGKLSTQHSVSPMLLAMLASSSGLAAIAVTQSIIKLPVDYTSKGISLGLAAGVAGGLGSILFFSALRVGKASVVIPLSALYPIITVLLSIWVLKESISPTQGLAIIFAMAAVVLFAL